MWQKISSAIFSNQSVGNWALALMLFVVPLTAKLPGVGIGTELLFSALVIFAGLLAHKEKTYLPTSLYLAVVVFFITAALSLLNSYNQGETTQALVRFALYAGLVFIVAKDSDNWLNKIKVPLIALCLASFIIGIIALYQYFFRTDLAIGLAGLEDVISNRVSGTFGNPNFLAEYLVLIVPVGIALCITAQRTWQKVCFAAVSSLGGVALYLTYTRGSLVGLAVALAVLSSLKNRKLIVPLALLFVVGILAVPGMSQRVMSILSLEGTAQDRINLWKTALYILSHNPLVGVGLGSYPFAYEKYVIAFPALDIGYIRYTAHNTFLMIGAETGLFGLTSYLIILLVGLVSGVLALRKVEQKQGWILAGLIAGCTGYLVNGFTSNTFYHPRSAVIYWVFYALILGVVGREYSSKKLNSKKLVLAAGILTIILVGAQLVLQGNFHSRQLVEKLALNNEQKRIETIKAQGAEKQAIVLAELERLGKTGVLSDAKKNQYMSVFNELLRYYDELLEERSLDQRKIRAQKDLAFVVDNTVALAKKGLQKYQLSAIFELTLPVNIKYYQGKEELPKYSYTFFIDKDISPVPMVYYVNQGFQYLPLAAVREAGTSLKKGKDDEFWQIYGFVKDTLKPGMYNGKDYLMSETFFSWNGYGPTWTSGMYQGEILRVIGLAYQKYKDPRLLADGNKLLNGMKVPYDAGGVLYIDPADKMPWILEYGYNISDMELNGSIIGSIGVYVYAYYTDDAEAMELYKATISKNFKELPKYDYPTGDLPQGASWSKYSLTVFPAQQKYHKLHLELLMSLQQLPNNKDLPYYSNVQIYIDKWIKAYQTKTKEPVKPQLFFDNK